MKWCGVCDPTAKAFQGTQKTDDCIYDSVLIYPYDRGEPSIYLGGHIFYSNCKLFKQDLWTLVFSIHKTQTQKDSQYIWWLCKWIQYNTNAVIIMEYYLPWHHTRYKNIFLFCEQFWDFYFSPFKDKKHFNNLKNTGQTKKPASNLLKNQFSMIEVICWNYI